MNEPSEITSLRKLNLTKINELFATQQELAELLEISPAYLNHLLTGHRNIGEKTARKLERRLKKPSGWLDADQAKIALDATHDATLLLDITGLNDVNRELVRALVAQLKSAQEAPETWQGTERRRIDNSPIASDNWLINR
jgi:plasmid maintenance system antidote protein VapI